MAQLGDLIVTGSSHFLNDINGNITGDAGTVNNHTVEIDVPSSAVFTDTIDRLRLKASVKAGSDAIVAKNIIVADSSTKLYKHLKLGTAFDITYPILYAGSDIAANETSTNTYLSVLIKIATTQSMTLTANQMVYIKGTLNGTIFTPISTTPLTQTPAASNDGYDYIELGYATSTTEVYLTQTYKIIKYINSAFRDRNATSATQIPTSSTKWKNVVLGTNTSDNFGSAPASTGALCINQDLSYQASTGSLRTVNIIADNITSPTTGYWTASTAAAIGDTTITISNSNITATSVIDVYTSNNSGSPIVQNTIVATTGSVTITFPALTEATNFRVWIRNV